MKFATPFDELPDKRQEVLISLYKVQHEFTGRSRYRDGVFARSQANAAFRANSLGIQTSTWLLNQLVHDGYLEQTRQGGGAAFVLDRNADPDAGERVTGTTPGQLSELARQVLDRNGISADLSDVDFGDWNEVRNTVNGLVGSEVLVIRSAPNRYTLTDDARRFLRDKAEDD